MATDTQAPVVAARGGSFLIEDRAPEEVFTPEDFSEEQRMIGQTAADFMQNEMLPRLPEILSLKYEATRELLRNEFELVMKQMGTTSIAAISPSSLAE